MSGHSKITECSALADADTEVLLTHDTLFRYDWVVVAGAAFNVPSRTIPVLNERSSGVRRPLSRRQRSS